MLGLVPGIHVSQRSRARTREWPGHLTRSRASRFYPARTASKLRGSVNRATNLRRQRGLGFFGDRLERRRLVDGEVREHLAVDRDARLGEAVDKDAVGHAERAHRGVEALDPQRAKRALPALGVHHFAGSGHLEALFSARLGLQLGHLALLLPQKNAPKEALSRLKCSLER